MFKGMSATRLGAISALVAVMLFSGNDAAIKFLSGGYALHEVVLIRSLLGLLIVVAIIAPLTDGLAIIRTRRLPMHMLRGLLVVMANMTFFLGLAAMPLAEAVAIFFISPILITMFSMIFLGEKVGPRRWIAIFVGFVGVIIMMRPGTETFRVASFLPLIAAVCYAGLHMMTRLIGRTESAATMAFYIQITFIVVSAAMGLMFGAGQFADQSDPSLEFLFRAWVWPAPTDTLLLILLGIGSGVGGFLISQAYRVAPAAVIAPLEYIALPLSVLLGVLIFDEWPDAVAFVGILFILGSGLFTLWREAQPETASPVQTPRVRR
ncbi:DMT family transporter [Yoonia sp. MH D7]